MKCESCSAEVQTTFLNKVVGTVVKDGKGKKHYVCSRCQKQFRSKEDILQQL